MGNIRFNGKILSFNDFNEVALDIPAEDRNKAYEFIKKQGGYFWTGIKFSIKGYIFNKESVECLERQNLPGKVLPLSNGKYLRMWG